MISLCDRGFNSTQKTKAVLALVGMGQDWLICLFQIILVKGHWDKNQILLSRSSNNQHFELKNNVKNTQPVPCLHLPQKQESVVVINMEIQQQGPDWQELLHALVSQSTTCKIIF